MGDHFGRVGTVKEQEIMIFENHLSMFISFIFKKACQSQCYVIMNLDSFVL